MRVAYFLFLTFSLAAQKPYGENERLYQQGEQALAEHRYEDAEQAYEKLRRLAPGAAEVHAKLGVIYFQQGKFQQALPVLRQALKLKPALPNVDTLLAMSLSELGQYKEALPGLERGFHKTADAALRRMSGLQLERAYTGLQQDSKAVEVALEMNRLYPNDPEVLYQAGKLYGNYAFLTMRKLAEVAPDSTWRHQAAGEAYESEGSYNRAVEEYRKVLSANPGRAGIHFRVGRSLLERGRRNNTDEQAEASKEFEQELELDPTNANAAYELAEIWRKGGQLEKARALFETALRYYPDFEEAHVGIAAALISLARQNEALPHLQQAISLNPADEVAYYRVSQVYKALGNEADQQKALLEFRRLRALQSKQDAERREVTKQEAEPEEK
jgi:tetratricopeptide (TPR) repeat protein